MTSGAGEIIYKAFAPTIKIMICISVGYLLSKKGLFTAAHSKGVSILTLNVSLPALTFGSMVSSLSVQNSAAFGPLFLIAILYEVLGLLAALFIREVFYLPPDFRYGIIVMGVCSNWGNLPTAVVQTVAKSAPFDPDTDVSLGVAYIAIFVFIMNFTLFPCGLHKLCALDFREENLGGARQLPFKQRWATRWTSVRSRLTRGTESGEEDEAAEEEKTDGSDRLGDPRRNSSTSSHGERGDEPTELLHRKPSAAGAEISRKKSRAASFTSMIESTRSIPPTEPLDAAGPDEPCSSSGLPTCSTHNDQSKYSQPIPRDPSLRPPTFFERLASFLKELLMPLTTAILVGIICAVIQPVKALFVTVDGWTGTRIPNAPDGNPPLAFITDTCTFLGYVAIPAGLILLGASFARIKVPRNWRDLPIAAIIAMTVAKMIIIPVFGVFVVQAMRDRTNMFPRDDKMRIFASILLAGTPASVNQLVITQLYNPAGTSDTLSSFLLLQYLTMPVLSTILAAVALYIAEQ